jgi:hypothetical protein
MNYIFYIGCCLVLVILQTAVLPSIPGFSAFYDLSILSVFYFGLFRPLREGLPMIFALGFTMDNLSGAPFGLYMTTYFWLYAGVKWITRFLRVGNIILLPVLLVGGILVQNLIFLGTITAYGSWPHFNLGVVKTGVFQILWAVTTGPVLLVLFHQFHQRWDRWILALVAKREGSTD